MKTTQFLSLIQLIQACNTIPQAGGILPIDDLKYLKFKRFPKKSRESYPFQYFNN